MKIIEEGGRLSTHVLCRCAEMEKAGPGRPGECDLLVEHTLEVVINGVTVLNLVCTPSDLPELILGRLFTEGIILGCDEVEEIHLNYRQDRAEITLRREEDPAAPEQDEHYVETLLTSCPDNRLLCNRYCVQQPLRPLIPIRWDREWIFSLARILERGTELYCLTRGAHSCSLSVDGDALYLCEDIGRHNALDKVVGCALRDGVDLRHAVLYTSGRVPTDMARKVIRAGIPVMASKTVPTQSAVEMARKYRLTLLCMAVNNRFQVFSAPEQE